MKVNYGNLLKNATSLAGEVSIGEKVTGLHGVWGARFLNCQLHGLVYNTTERYVELLDDVWRENEILDEWLSATETRLDYSATMDKGVLVKNGVIVDDDGWRWVNNQHIQLIGDMFKKDDLWQFSYEQNKVIITPVMHIGVIPVERKVLVDGYVARKYEGELKKYNIQEDVIFDENFMAILKLGWCITQDGILKTRRGRILQGWRFEDTKTIRVEPYELRANEEYILEYVGVWDWLIYDGVEVWFCHSNNGLSWSIWEKVEFGQEVRKNNFYMLRLRFRENIKANTVRVRSLVVKVL